VLAQGLARHLALEELDGDPLLELAIRPPRREDGA
jgi:hypothetical protein